MIEFNCLDTDWQEHEGYKERRYFWHNPFVAMFQSMFGIDRCPYCKTAMQEVWKETITYAKGCDGKIRSETEYCDTDVRKCTNCGYDYTIPPSYD